jgi:DNA polymerase III subunit epsilon
VTDIFARPSEVAQLPWYDRPMVGFDVETTGVRREHDRVVTATLTYDSPGTSAFVREWLINPGIEIPAEATEVNGITNEMLAEQGQDAAEAIAAYNAMFDVSIMDREQRRHGLPTIFADGIKGGPTPFVLCPMTIDKAVNPYVKGRGMRKLTPTAARYGVELKDAHQATADVRAALDVARRLHLPQPADQDDRFPEQITRRRTILADASEEDLRGWQVAWHRDQKLGLAKYFAGQRNRQAALECRAEAPYFPLFPVGAPYPEPSVD